MIRYAAAALTFTLAGAVSAEPIPLTQGDWDVDMTFDFLGESITESYAECLLDFETNMEATELAAELAGGADCTAHDVVQTPGKVSMRLACPASVGMTAAWLVLSHTPETLDISGTVEVSAPEWGAMNGQLSITAARTGVCPAE